MNLGIYQSTVISHYCDSVSDLNEWTFGSVIMASPKMTKKFRSYCITVRHRRGVLPDSDFEKRFVNWIKKQDNGIVVAEMEGEKRHLHAQIWLDDAKPKASICRTIERISAQTVPDWDRAQRVVQFGKKGDKNLKGGVRIATSDWHKSYLLENPDKQPPEENNILFFKLPESTTEYYPSKEEQEAAMARGTRAVDYKYAALADRYKEWALYKGIDPDQPATPYGVACALQYAMFKAKTMCVLRDTRTKMDTVLNLVDYLNASEEPLWFTGVIP